MKIFIISLLFTGLATIVNAQPVQNPNFVEFTASPDHNALLGGVPLVDHYEVAIVIGTATGALAWSEPIGKPTPDASNKISVNVPRLATLARGTYIGFISTVSLLTNPFSVQSSPSTSFTSTGSLAPSGTPVFLKK